MDACMVISSDFSCLQRSNQTVASCVVAGTALFCLDQRPSFCGWPASDGNLPLENILIIHKVESEPNNY